MIVQELRLIQERCGYLSHHEMRLLAERLRVPLHRVHEVASFYPLYRLQPPPAVEVKVCRDMACHLRGAERLQQSLAAYGREVGDGQVEVGGVSCLGQCDRPVAVTVNDHHIYRGMSESELRTIITKAVNRDRLPHQKPDSSPRGWKIDPYNGQPRYEAIKQFLEGGRDVAALLKKLEAANLRGMGGAGFPTFRKWSAVRGAPGAEKYVVCNADESEPGTFKDRELMRRTPHLLIEGIVLAGLVTGAKHGYIYVRHEFPDEIDALEEALREARDRYRVVGDDILDSGISFPVEVFVSPGGYIQGEESALLEAMEDRRGEPRNKPPFPVFNGLFNKPTVINNVETLCWVPVICLRGGEWYRDQGINGATGLRFVSISGDITRPGVYEVPFGLKVRDLITLAGGLNPGRRLKAIAPSGPSGGFLPGAVKVANLPEKFVKEKMPAGAESYNILDLPLDLNTVGLMGSMLGAAFVVYDETRDMVENALNCTQFFRNESCGKCVPCRVGSQKLVDIGGELLNGKVPRDQLGLINELSEAMTLASICGLGQVASNPLATVLKHFRRDVEKHLAPTGGGSPGRAPTPPKL